MLLPGKSRALIQIGGILLFFLFSAHTPSVVADETSNGIPIEQFFDRGPGVDNVGGYTGVLVEDSAGITNQLSNMVGMYFDRINNTWIQKKAFVCTTYNDSNCSKAQNVWYTAVLKVCQTPMDTNCLFGVSAIRGGKEIVGKFAENYPASSNYVFKGDSSAQIPDGDLPSIWTFDGLSHDGGDKFLVFARFTHNGGWYNFYPINLKPDQFGVGIFAISKVKNPKAHEFRINVENTGIPGKSVGWEGPSARTSCLSSGPEGECSVAWPLPEDVRFSIKIKTNMRLSNFLHGRFVNPSFSMQQGATNEKVLTIEAGSVRVPVLNVWSKNSEMPKGLYDHLYAMPNWGGTYYYVDGKGESRDNVQLLLPSLEYDENALMEYQWWLDLAKNRSIGNRSMWVVRTLSPGEMDRAGSRVAECLTKSSEISGLVSTDAGMYISSPPTFNEATQTLDYKVSAPHLDNLGKPNVGNYNLILNGNVARCIYGFSEVPISATVSVVSSDSSQQVATTAVSEKDGWLYLSASGFGYSSPTIKVKITQQKPTIVTTPTQQIKKVKSIICVKGKFSKTIKGTNPKCPTGYKKK